MHGAHLSCINRWQQTKRWSATTRCSMPGCTCRKCNASLLPMLLGPNFWLGDTGLQWRPTSLTKSFRLAMSRSSGSCWWANLLATLHATAQAPDASRPRISGGEVLPAGSRVYALLCSLIVEQIMRKGPRRLTDQRTRAHLCAVPLQQFHTAARRRKPARRICSTWVPRAACRTPDIDARSPDASSSWGGCHMLPWRQFGQRS